MGRSRWRSLHLAWLAVLPHGATACRDANPAFRFLHVDAGPPDGVMALPVPADAGAAAIMDAPPATDGKAAIFLADGPTDGPPVATSIDAGLDAGTDAGIDGRSANCPPWWLPAWKQRVRFTLDPGASALPARAWSSVTVDHGALVAAGARVDGLDLRVVRFESGGFTEVPWFLDEQSAWKSAKTTIWFRNGSAIPAGMPDVRHYLYFGNVAASSFAQAPAAVFKGLRTGTVVHSTRGAHTVPLTPAVDPARSFTVFQTRSAGSRPVHALLRTHLARPDALEIVRNSDEAVPLPVNVRYYIAEFANGVRVQRGTTVQTTTVFRANLRPLSSRKQAFVTWSRTVTADNNAWGYNDTMSGMLFDESILEMRTGMKFAIDEEIASWEVVEYTNPADIQVTAGTFALAAGETDAEGLAPSSFDARKTFLLSGFTTVGQDERIGARMLRAHFGPTGQVRIHRDASGVAMPHVGWQAVQLDDGSRVHPGLFDFAAGEARKSVPVPGEFDPDRSMPFASGQVGGGQSMGSTPLVTDHLVGVCTVTFVLVGSDLVAERGNTADRCSVAWFVVEFPRAGVVRSVGSPEVHDDACLVGP